MHIIQDHLRQLSDDLGRFRQRMDKLAVPIRQAHEDVKQVNTSARKISSRLQDIDQVQLPVPEAEGPGGEDRGARTEGPGELRGSTCRVFSFFVPRSSSL